MSIEINKNYWVENHLYKSIKNKKKIILGDTFLNIDEYLNKVLYRNNGKPYNISHFTIDKKGNIYQHTEPFNLINFIDSFSIDDQSISIAFENLNSVKMLSRADEETYFVDWRGRSFDDKFYHKCWRGNDYWDRYTKNQIKKGKELCEFLCDEFNIEKKFINTNTKIKRAYDFHGIVSRSNFSDYYYDVNPSFYYQIINQISIENEDPGTTAKSKTI